MANESITFSFGADTKGMTDALDGLLGKLAGLAAAFLSVQAVIEAFGQAIDLGGRLNDLSTRTGETAGNLAILERAFENTSVGADKVGPAIAKMQVAITNFAQGSDSAVQAFEQLGLSLEQLQGRSPTEQLELIGQRLSTIPNDAERAALAVQIFGRAGSELIPVLVNFANETKQAREQLGSLPDILTNTAAVVDSLGDNLYAIRNKGLEMAYGFLSEVVPAVDTLARKLAGIDAAAIGVGLADILTGAFANPLKAAELLGNLLLKGAMNYGNTLISAADYFYQLIRNTLAGMGIAIPEISNGLVEGAINFGKALLEAITDSMSIIRGITAAFGPFGAALGQAISAGLFEATGALGGLDEFAKKALINVVDFGQKLGSSFSDAYEKTQYIYKEFFKTGIVNDAIQKNWEEITKSGKELVETLGGDFSSSAMAAGRTFGGSDIDPLTKILINENIEANRDNTDATVSNTRSVNALAAAMKTLGLISESGEGTAIGPAASAQKAQALQKQIEQLQATGGSQERIDALQRSLRTNLDIALGANLTAKDRDAATQWARDHLNDPEYADYQFQDLEKMAQNDLLKRKEDRLGVDDIMKQNQQDKQEEQTKDAGQPAKEEKAANTIQGIAQQLLKLLQKIEPRVPVANLT